VAKALQDKRTHVEVLPLVAEERRNELAQMLGPVSEGTLQSADEILQIVHARTAKGRLTPSPAEIAQENRIVNRLK
jgi:hypothetical protein